MDKGIDNRITRFTGHPVANLQRIGMALTMLLSIALVTAPLLALGQTTNAVTGPQTATRGPADTFTGTLWGNEPCFPMTRSIRLLMAASLLSQPPVPTGILIRRVSYSLSPMGSAITR